MNVKKWRISERDSLDKAMEFFEENMYKKALPIFAGLLSQHPDEDFLKYSYAKCALYRDDTHEDSYKYFNETYPKNKKLNGIQYDMALVAHYNYKFDEALEYLELYKSSKGYDAEGKIKAAQLNKYINNAKWYVSHPTNAEVSNLGTTINSEYDEYAPVITADESRLIFTYAGIKSVGGKQNDSLKPDPFGDYLEDIYLSDKKEGEFIPAVSLDSINTNLPEAAISLSNDGSVLFVYQDIEDGHGDLFQSNLKGDLYAPPVKLKGEVNSYSWDGHCSLSPDGNLLYFSSERVDGFGGRDIYRATLLPDSTWGNIVNLGDSVNTIYDDDAPFISADGITLFFSSKGRTSMGGYDIFKAVMDPLDSSFKRSENLGYPINSPTDDIYFVMAADGNTSYYSSGKKGGYGRKDIYKVKTNFTGSKLPVYLVKGVTKYQDKPVAATITVLINSKNDKLFKRTFSNESNGNYLVCLPAGAVYQLTYAYKDKPSQTFVANAVDLSNYMENTHNVNFEVTSDVLASNTTTSLNAVTSGKEAVTSVKTPTVSATVAKNESTSDLEAMSQITVKETATVATTVKLKTKEQGTKAAWDFTTNPVSSTPLPDLPKPAKTVKTTETAVFEAVNGPQKKSMRFAEKYGNSSAPEMTFWIQIAAVLNDRNSPLPNKSKLGKIEKLDLNDGYIRITAGGKFNTLNEALEHNKKVVKAGQKEGFIIALYKGKRVQFEELEQMGLLK